MIYLLILSWTILWELQVPWIGHPAGRIVKLIPFLPTGTAGSSRPFEIAMNIALFTPLGAYLGYFAPSWSRTRILSLIIGTNLVFETIQYLLAIGVADTTDIINNTLGGVLGAYTLSIARRRFRGRTEAILLRIILIGTAGALVLVTAYVLATPLHLGGPPVDLAPPTRYQR